MSIVQNDEAGRRLWQAVGGVVFGEQAGTESDFIISNRNGQITVDARPVATAQNAVVGNVGGFQITLPMVLLISGIVAYLALRK